MNTVITSEKIELPPGAVLKLLGSWQECQRMVLQLGDRSIPRIKYRPGEILLMAPLPEHGKDASLLSPLLNCAVPFRKRGLKVSRRDGCDCHHPFN